VPKRLLELLSCFLCLGLIWFNAKTVQGSKMQEAQNEALTYQAIGVSIINDADIWLRNHGKNRHD